MTEILAEMMRYAMKVYVKIILKTGAWLPSMYFPSTLLIPIVRAIGKAEQSNSITGAATAILEAASVEL